MKIKNTSIQKCNITDKDNPIIYYLTTKGKFYFYNSLTGDFICSYTPEGLYNNSYCKSKHAINVEIKHIGGL